VAFSREELLALRGRTLPDLVAPGVRLLFAGINPGLWTVAVQAHFGRRGNRFWPALHRAGITDRAVDASRGLRPEDVAHLHARGVGITNLAPGATARADEVPAAELVAGVAVLRAKVEAWRPAVVAVLGITAYRTAFGRPRASAGRQPEDLAGAQLWVAPNPSGLNAHATLGSLAAAYREIAVAAGIPVLDAPGA
jgi:double-stranded uracil-DNA glycosylase